MKPTTRTYNNGRIKSETWRNEAGKFHRLDGPAIQGWYEDGQVEHEIWYINGNCHRIDGPAIQYWYKNGHLECEQWRIDDKLHKLDGPAHRGWHKNGQLIQDAWWINGVEYKTETEFQVAVDLYKADEIAELF